MSELQVKRLKIGSDPLHIRTQSGMFIAEVEHVLDDAKDCARRLAAAWNATRQFTVADLKAGVVGEMVEIVRMVERGEAHLIPDDRIRAALAKVQPAD